MVRLFLAAIVLAVFALRPAGAVEVQRVVSPGGIEAWLVEEHAVPIVSMRFVFRGGSALDPVGKEGLAELASGLLNEGAGDMDALAFQKALDDSAVRMSFEAGIDEFGGSLATLTETGDVAYELLALALREPRFDDDAVARVRAQLIAGLERAARDGNNVARRQWYARAFSGHPYARPPGGTIAGVEAITRDDLLAFTGARFGRDQLILGVAGDITAADLGRVLDLIFGDLPATAQPGHIADTVPGAAGTVHVERLPQPQSVLLMGQVGLKRSDTRYYTAYVMNHIFGGGGFSSRLNMEVREKRGLAYGIFSYMVSLDHVAAFMIGTATQNARVSESLAVIRDEVTRLRDEGVSEQELADAKTYLTGSFPLRLDSNGEIASMLVGMQIADLGIDYLDHRNSLIEGVTRDDIATLAAELLDPDSFAVIVVGEPEGIDATSD
ncbi:MAG: pitrilysin family protein [Alphaproteobacteria bacterium]|jgi:zinc protease|nr:pitrilysin family protein [Alphaproteobacteria bacterium]